MQFFLRKSLFEYELIDKDGFNKVIKNEIGGILENNKHIELSILIRKLKKSYDGDIFIFKNNKYKIRNINTYIKEIYGSFLQFLDFNNIKYKNMICIN